MGPVTAGRVEIMPSLPAFGYSTKLCGRGRAGQRSTEMMDELDWAELSLLSLASTRVTIINLLLQRILHII